MKKNILYKCIEEEIGTSSIILKRTNVKLEWGTGTENTANECYSIK